MKYGGNKCTYFPLKPACTPTYVWKHCPTLVSENNTRHNLHCKLDICTKNACTCIPLNNNLSECSWIFLYKTAMDLHSFMNFCVPHQRDPYTYYQTIFEILTPDPYPSHSCFPEPFELTHCWEGDEPLHQQPGGRAEAARFLDQHVQAHLKKNKAHIIQTILHSEYLQWIERCQQCYI